MPLLRRTVNCQLSTACPPKPWRRRVNSRRWRRGFTLIEIALSLLFILALVTILLTASGTFRTTRKGNLQGIATKIASRQIESLRNTAFASLPVSGNFSDPDLSKLPNSSASQTLDDYEASTKIKLVKIQVNWTESGATQNIKLETLISENGL